MLIHKREEARGASPQAGRPGDEGGRGFRRARRSAFLARLGDRLRRLQGRAPCCESLRCFEVELAERGLEREGRAFEAVEVGSIEGSVSRCGAFDASFLPVCSCSTERWRRVYEAFLEGKALPPVELYKMGGTYLRGSPHASINARPTAKK